PVALGWYLMLLAGWSLSAVSRRMERAAVILAVIWASAFAALLIAAQVFATIAMGPAALDSNAPIPPRIPWADAASGVAGFAALIVLTLVSRRVTRRADQPGTATILQRTSEPCEVHTGGAGIHRQEDQRGARAVWRRGQNQRRPDRGRGGHNPGGRANEQRHRQDDFRRTLAGLPGDEPPGVREGHRSIRGVRGQGDGHTPGRSSQRVLGANRPSGETGRARLRRLQDEPRDRSA